MSDPDSDSDNGVLGRTRPPFKMEDMVITFRPSEDIFNRWYDIPLDKKREAVQRMKICSFWLPILLQRDECDTVRWAIEMGLISANENNNINLKHIRRIEIVETIFRALERGVVKRNESKHIVLLSNRLNLRSADILDDSFRWLLRTGEPDIQKQITELNSGHICFTALHFIFTEYARLIQDLGGSQDRRMKELMTPPSDFNVEKSEEMKKKGNEHFEKQQYEEAVKYYSKAIEYYPDNHKLYGNRALSFIRCKKYLKAVGDGKRATLIKPVWAKGHYRYCEALFSLGHYEMAIKANKLAQMVCKDDHEGVKDLETQFCKYTTTFPMAHPGPPRGYVSAGPLEQGQSLRLGLVTPSHKSHPAASTSPKVVNMDKQTRKPVRTPQKNSNSKDLKPPKSEPLSKSEKGESNATAKKKSKNKTSYPGKQSQVVVDAKADRLKEFRSLVEDAHTAMADLRTRNAEQAFSRALTFLETVTTKELGLSTIDELLLLFGHASALIQIGRPEELTGAEKLLEKIKSYDERTFQCLVYYAFGKLYLRENRFAVALQQFLDSLQMVKNQITPGKLTWPLTKEIVKETQPDCFKEILEDAIELCKFPPLPDAICRLDKCLCPVKAEIYITDPDFKGFIRICCCEDCTVEYHVTCWKTLKASAFSEKSEKDLLQEACLTPDCIGQICSITIFCPTGVVKCKFEAAVLKPQTLKKPKVNQNCTSLKKLKSKEEHKLKRKQHKVSFQDKEDKQILQQQQDSAAPSQQKVWLVYRDRVLLQINQNVELLRGENGLHISVLFSSLKPWLELDFARGNQLAGRMLNWQQEQLETLGQVAELLLERKNRVWARVFIQELSSCVNINPKLSNWAHRLNDGGLNAAQNFIERYAGRLEQLDLSRLLKFGPLQDMIIEKLGTSPELFSSIGLTVTEYLKQAPPHDMRLFIWTMDEHKDEYVSCHTILDEYFDMLDGHCSVLKKSDESQNNSPIKAKSRGRKKKQKEPKGVIVLSGMRSVNPRDEWDQEFFEDDSLSFLDTLDSFTVPSHLRDQVAEFEDQYDSRRHRSHYKHILDNNPDSTKESLYDYFAQILDEHGPLVAEDPLLVGELENFPSEAKRKIEAARGFEPFLLDSLRFIKIGRCIGLAKHAVSLQQAERGASLDDLDEIAPDNNSESPVLYTGDETSFTSYMHDYSSAQTEDYTVLPNPYASGFQPLYQPVIGSYFAWSNGDDQEPDNNFSPNGYEDLYLDPSEFNRGVWETNATLGTSVTTNEIFLSHASHAAVQTCQEAMRSVAVNTELHEGFEKSQGDINKQEKSNRSLEQQIKKMTNDKVNVGEREDVVLLQEEVQKITANIQVTNKELTLFQQKLEEEVKRDQKEKKANQEALRSLKQEIEELLEQQGRLAQSIQEKKTSYEAKLNDFLELSNQLAAEKMSLEDEIERCKVLISSASRRSHTALLSLMESSRDQSSHGLYKELADAKALLNKLDEALHRFPNQDLEAARNSCRDQIKEVEKRISTAERQYQDQMDQVNTGRRVTEMHPVNSHPEPAAAPVKPVQKLSAAAKEFTLQSSAQASRGTPPPIHHSAPPAAEAPAPPSQHKHPIRTSEPGQQPNTVFGKAMETLSTMFPDYTRSELMKFVQELRSSSGGSFSSMTLQDVVGGVTQLILDHQERFNSTRSSVLGRGSPAQCATPPLINPAPVWQPIGQQRVRSSNALNIEDPCIICHDEMSPDDTCVLECRHSFHNECIRSWLKEQSTCPTCRTHALLPEDFPMLTGRRRPAP